MQTRENHRRLLSSRFSNVAKSDAKESDHCVLSQIKYAVPLLEQTSTRLEEQKNSSLDGNIELIASAMNIDAHEKAFWENQVQQWEEQTESYSQENECVKPLFTVENTCTGTPPIPAPDKPDILLDSQKKSHDKTHKYVTESIADEQKLESLEKLIKIPSAQFASEYVKSSEVWKFHTIGNILYALDLSLSYPRIFTDILVANSDRAFEISREACKNLNFTETKRKSVPYNDTLYVAGILKACENKSISRIYLPLILAIGSDKVAKCLALLDDVYVDELSVMAAFSHAGKKVMWRILAKYSEQSCEQNNTLPDLICSKINSIAWKRSGVKTLRLLYTHSLLDIVNAWEMATQENADMDKLAFLLYEVSAGLAPTQVIHTAIRKNQIEFLGRLYSQSAIRPELVEKVKQVLKL